jgi:hypothetical protein
MSLDTDERNKFHEELAELIAKYPGLSNEPEYHEDCDCGFDPDSPKMLTGVLLVLSYQNMDAYNELFWTDPLHQSHFTSVGLAAAAYHEMLENS